MLVVQDDGRDVAAIGAAWGCPEHVAGRSERVLQACWGPPENGDFMFFRSSVCPMSSFALLHRVERVRECRG
eukprot:1083356-Prymnesium_polylepis.1